MTIFEYECWSLRTTVEQTLLSLFISSSFELFQSPKQPNYQNRITLFSLLSPLSTSI